MAEEKFISIDYATWNTKYKPMEAELNRLRIELSEEKQNRQHNVYLNIRDTGFIFYVMHDYYTDIKHFDHSAKVAVLEIDKTHFNTVIDYKAIEDAITSTIIKMERVGNMALSVTRIAEEQEKFTKFYDKFKEQENRLKRLPKLIRWLFKIKL